MSKAKLDAGDDDGPGRTLFYGPKRFGSKKPASFAGGLGFNLITLPQLGLLGGGVPLHLGEIL